MGDNAGFIKTNIDKNKSPKISEIERQFMKIIEQKNLERVQKNQIIRRRNIITGWAVGASVLGIYFYSMFAIKQEKFLDDFNEPEKIHKSA